MMAEGARGVLLVLLLFVSRADTCDKQVEESRGFIGKETAAGVEVDAQAAQVLSGRLTTAFLPAVYVLVFVVALPTNALAVWVFLFRTKKKSASSIYMANLALADLLFVVWVPLKISYHLNGNDWIYGEALCDVLVAFFYANMYGSIAFIACISVQRYWAVVHPMSRHPRTGCIAASVSAGVWAAVWLLTAPLYLYDQEVYVPNLDVCTCHDVTRPSQGKMAAGYFLTMGALGFVVPAAVCVVSYVLMLRALRRSMADSSVAQKRRKAVVLIVTVLVMFVVCFAPSNVMLLVHYSLLLSGVQNNLYGFYVTTLCLASLNCCFDPFVYYFISEDFREHVKNTFLCRSERTAQRMRVSFTALKFSRKTNTYKSDSGNTQSTEC